MVQPPEGSNHKGERCIEEPLRRAIKNVMFLVDVQAQEAAAEHRGEGDGHHAGDQNRDADGDGNSWNSRPEYRP